MESDDPTEQHDLGPGAGVDPDDDGHAALDATLQEVLEVGDELDATLQEVLGDGGQWQEAQWQLAVCVGGASIDGELTEAVVHADGLAALQAAALAAADLRSRTVVCVPDTGAESLSCWAYVSGLAGRVLDVVADDQLYDCTGPLSSGREAEETGRPGRKIDSFQVTVAQVLNGLDRDEVGAARYARRTSLVWCDDPVVYQAAAWLAGVRDRRGDGGRLPQLDIDGEELDRAHHRQGAALVVRAAAPSESPAVVLRARHHFPRRARRDGDRPPAPPRPDRPAHSGCRPHSVLLRPAHRPARGSCPSATGRVQGMQPMDG